MCTIKCPLPAGRDEQFSRRMNIIETGRSSGSYWLALGSGYLELRCSGRAVDGMASLVTWTECMSCCLFVGLCHTRIPAIFEDSNRRLDWLILRHALRRGILPFSFGSRGFGGICTLPGTRRHLRWRLCQLEPILCPKRRSLCQCILGRSATLCRWRARTRDSRLAHCSLGRSGNLRRSRGRPLDVGRWQWCRNRRPVCCKGVQPAHGVHTLFVFGGKTEPWLSLLWHATNTRMQPTLTRACCAT